MIGTIVRSFTTGLVIGRTACDIHFRARQAAYRHANQTMRQIREAEANGFFAEDKDTTKGDTTNES